MEIQVHYYYYHKDRWEQVPRTYTLGEDFLYHENGARYQCRFSPNSASGGYDYELEMEAPYPTQLPDGTYFGGGKGVLSCNPL